MNCVRPRNDSRLKDILNFADSRVLGDRLYAAQCSNSGYTSVKPLLESRAQPWAVDFSDGGSVLTLKMQLPRGATSKALLYFRLPRSHHMPRDRNEASRCHTLLDGWQKRRHSDRSVILMELRMSN